MTIRTERELYGCFREIDQAEIEAPLERGLPLEVEDVLVWNAGPRAFLIFRDRPGGTIRGIVFHRNGGALPDAVAMCEWCHAVRGHGQVKLLSVATDARHRVGLYLCADLDCLDRLEAPPGPDDLREGLDARARRRRIVERIASFARRRLA
jgi:hypothetical protein